MPAKTSHATSPLPPYPWAASTSPVRATAADSVDLTLPESRREIYEADLLPKHAPARLGAAQRRSVRHAHRYRA